MYRYQVQDKSGYTLVELLITIAIIGVLVSVVLPRLNSARDKATVANAQVELSSLKAAMASLYDDTGRYPNGVNDYCRAVPGADNEVALASSTAGLVSNGSGWSGWSGPYAATVEDPWGTSYFLDEDYDCDPSTTGCRGQSDTTSVLVSCGPDRDTGGANGSCAYTSDDVVIRLCD